MIQSFICWRCLKKIYPEDVLPPFKKYPSNADLLEADLACRAEVCSECLAEIEKLTYEESDIWE
jgi:hypothetical protein